MGRKSNLHVDREIFNEIIRESNVNKLEKMDKLFDAFESNINKVAKLIENIPDDSVVRPNKTWLSMFGLG